MFHNLKRDFSKTLKQQIKEGTSKGWTYIGVFGRGENAILKFISESQFDSFRIWSAVCPVQFRDADFSQQCTANGYILACFVIHQLFISLLFAMRENRLLCCYCGSYGNTVNNSPAIVWQQYRRTARDKERRYTIVLASLELVHLQIKTDCTR